MKNLMNIMKIFIINPKTLDILKYFYEKSRKAINL